MHRIFRAICAFGLVIYIGSCSEPVALSLPDDAPDHDGIVISRAAPDQTVQILVDEAPGTDPCRAGKRITAAYFRVHSRTEVLIRTHSGKLQSFPADSLIPGTHVRAWKDNWPSRDSCPPIMGAKVIEVIR